MADWYDSAKDAANAATGENHGSFARAFNAYWLKVKAAGGSVVAAQTAPAALTDSSGGAASGTLAAVAAGASYAQADIVALKNAVASLNAQVNSLIASLKTAGVLK